MSSGMRVGGFEDGGVRSEEWGAKRRKEGEGVHEEYGQEGRTERTIKTKQCQRARDNRSNPVSAKAIERERSGTADRFVDGEERSLSDQDVAPHRSLALVSASRRAQMRGQTKGTRTEQNMQRSRSLPFPFPASPPHN